MSYGEPSRELLDLTQSMLSAAEKGDWGEVEKIEMRRQSALQRLAAEISTTNSDTAIDTIVAQMRDVLSLNYRMMDLGRQTKAELVKAMGGLNQGRKAVNAYHGIG